jgi:hypothetical protein
MTRMGSTKASGGIPVWLLLTAAFELGCGLFVGDIDGSLAHTGTADARLSDAGQGHREADAFRLEDGGRDRVAAPDSHEASIHDAGVPREAAGDARSTPVPFCTTVVAPPGAAFVCDDFDENPDATILGGEFNTAGPLGTIRVEADASASPPNALFFGDAIPSDASAMTLLSRPFPATTTLTMQLDLNADALNADGGASNTACGINIKTSAGAAATVFLAFGVDHGAVVDAFIIEGDPFHEDGGHFGVAYGSHPGLAWPGGWTRVKLSLATLPGGEVVDTVAIDGVELEKNYGLASTINLGGGGTFVVGLDYVTGASRHELLVDNVVMYSSN